MIRIVATDLDGTLIGNGEEPEDYRVFAAMLVDMHAQWGTRWGIITGRHLNALRGILTTLQLHRLVPDFIVVEDARIFTVDDRNVATPFFWWNMRVDARRLGLNWRHRRRLHRWRTQLRERFPKAQDLSRKGIDVWLRLSNLEEAVEAEDYLLEETSGFCRFLVFRWGEEVCIAPAIGTKAEALSRIAKSMRVEPEEVFAVGDGVNDVSMLRGEVARMPACVGNAVETVVAAVRKADGHICRNSGLKGVIEALQAYRRDGGRRGDEQDAG